MEMEAQMLTRWKPVLIVDDSKSMCAIMKNILLSLDFVDVQTRHTAIDAINEIKNRDYGFIICDVEMKPIDGIQFVKMVRRDKLLRDVPVILTTSNPASVLDIFKRGTPFLANGFILKPFKANDLKIKLAEVLEAAYQNKHLLPDHLARLNGFEIV
jgi:two-component system chemotaxis response regulator CheY